MKQKFFIIKLKETKNNKKKTDKKICFKKCKKELFFFIFQQKQANNKSEKENVKRKENDLKTICWLTKINDETTWNKKK